jgi:hypothetical protein
LPHGRYDVIIGIDRNGDDLGNEEVVQQRTMELARYDAIEFTAEPKRTYVIELKLVEKLDDMTGRPDLGLDPWDVRRGDGAMQVTVHNIGGSASPATTLCVQDAAGKTLGEAPVPALDPPLDLQPRTATVSIKLAAPPPPGARVVIDPAGSVSEITKVNNTAAF